MAWRFYIDGEDVSQVSFGKTVTRRLNRPASARCRIPAELTEVVKGESRIKVLDDNNDLYFHGIPYYIVDTGDADMAWTEILAYDPMIIWPGRPARDADADFSAPTFWTDYDTGPQMLQHLLENSATHEGPLFLDVSSGVFETGGNSLAALPLDYPMTIADVWGLLVDTGLVDVYIEPIDVGANVGRVNAYNGDFGSDLSGSVVMQWGTGSKNVKAITRTEDLSTLCNKLWYYLGPKVSEQVWKSNITGDGMADGNDVGTAPDPLPNPPGGDVDYSNPLGDLINASRTSNWVSMDIRTWDDDAATAARAMYARLWQAEMKARVNGKTMVSVTPTSGVEPDFNIGDLITVQAGTRLRGGFSGVQRVYELTVNITDDGVTEIGEIVASADQESS